MNCTRARSEIALWAGGDVDERETVQLQRHVALCAECREYRRRMVDSLQVLQEPASPAAHNLHDSVWPNVEARLSVQSQVEAHRTERLNRWLPAAAIAVACLAVIAITSEPQPRHQDVFGQPLPSDRVIWQSLQAADHLAIVGWQAQGDGIGLPDGQSLDQHDRQTGWHNSRSMSYDEPWLTMIHSLTGQAAPTDRFGQH